MKKVKQTGFKLEEDLIGKIDEIGRNKYRINTKGKRTQVLRMIVSEFWELHCEHYDPRKEKMG